MRIAAISENLASLDVVTLRDLVWFFYAFFYAKSLLVICSEPYQIPWPTVGQATVGLGAPRESKPQLPRESGPPPPVGAMEPFFP